MTNRQSVQTRFAAWVRRFRVAVWTLIGLGWLCVAMISAAQQPSVLEPKTIENEGLICKVTKAVYFGVTTKATPRYPVGSKVTGLNARCGNSPKPKSFLRVEYPGLPHSELFVATVGDVISLGFAVDPFEVGAFESTGSPLHPYHAYRYDLDTKEFLDLGTFGGPTDTSSAIGVNIDGSVVVGGSNHTAAGIPISQAFRWTPALGMQNLGAILPNGSSVAHATSDDGTVVVGWTDAPIPDAPPNSRAFRWVLSNPATGAGTMTLLGPTGRVATAVSSDGSVIAGQGTNLRAMRWTQSGGVVDLGVLPGHLTSMATAVSADGEVVVGISSPDFVLNSFPIPGPSFNDTTSRAFRWTKATGMRDLNTLLAATGVDLTGVTLLAALGLAKDGQTIAGSGIGAGDEETSGFTIRYADATTAAAPVPVVEFYNSTLDHYFIAHAADEIAKLDNGTFKGWARTGLSFKAYVTPQSGTSAVCRIYIPPGKGDGHFFGRDQNECDGTMTKNPTFILESAAFLQLYAPTLGTCAAGQVPVYRVYSNRVDANHRYTTTRAVRDQMVGKGWLAEGDGSDIVVMCAPA